LPPLAEVRTELPLTETVVSGEGIEATMTVPSPFTEVDKPAPLVNPPAEINQELAPERAWQSLDNLMTENYLPRDYYDTATQLGSSQPGERTILREPFTVGDLQIFKTDEGRIQAQLMAVTEHTYFWVETSLRFDAEEVAAAAHRFEVEYYPVVSDIFGQEWRPGVDNDPHFSVLHIDGYNGDEELGFFDSGDEYPWGVVADSNQQEMVYLNMSNLVLGDDLYQGTLIHETQHLIQWNNDANESVWLDEGLAQLTELYAGLDTVETATDYLHEPGTQLNTWNYTDENELYAHYGASYLFSVYLWEQLGIQAVAELSRHPANSLAGIQAVLAKYKPEMSLSEFVGNWAIANYLDNFAVAPEFGYGNLQLHLPVHESEVSSLDHSLLKTINQYGVHYIELNLTGPVTLSFAGDTTVDLTGMSEKASGQIWYAPGSDELDARLSAEFDLTALDKATLNFSAWYDLEETYDFVYVAVAVDDGEHWEILTPDHATSGEYGPALSGNSLDKQGNSGGWISNSVDLSPYTGQIVTVRFWVLTDSAVSGGGFAVDFISIPELNYTYDVESGSGDWLAEGFVLVERPLPQPWSLSLILDDDLPQVMPLSLNQSNQGRWTVTLGDQGGILVVSAQNPIVNTPASYWLMVE
jgi:hypothetical protein